MIGRNSGVVAADHVEPTIGPTHDTVGAVLRKREFRPHCRLWFWGRSTNGTFYFAVSPFFNMDVGNSVYIYSGVGVTPDDFDADAPEPVATTAVTQNQTGDYVYETLLSPGDYTVAFTCQAKNDMPDTSETISFVQPTNATIVDGQTTTISF